MLKFDDLFEINRILWPVRLYDLSWYTFFLLKVIYFLITFRRFIYPCTMLIISYFVLALLFIYLLIYLYKKNILERKRREELLQDWGKPKDGRYFDFDSIENYFLNTINESSDKLQLITEKIAGDLYLDEVFKLIDRTISRLGQQFLYARLRTIDKDTVQLKIQDALADKMAADQYLRINTQFILQDLEKNGSYYYQDLIYAKQISRPSFMPVVYLLSLLNIICLLLAIVHSGFLLVFMGIFIINSGIHYWNKNNVSVHASSLGEFLKVFEVAKKLNASPELNQHFPGTTDLIKELTPLKRKMIGVKLDNMAESDAAMVGFLLFELLKIAFNVEIIVFYAIITAILKKNEALKKLFKYIGIIDTAISIASFRSSAGYYCKPGFAADNDLNITGLQHPLIAECVPNDLQLNHKNLLLTGSNMSGKTTFIRSVGINMILAQTIFTCTARTFHMPYAKIFSSITIADSLLEDKSYYFEEMTIIKNFIRESAGQTPCFFILDEIFKGTNTIERVSAGKAILSYLAKSNNLVFVSTHDTELNGLLQGEYDLYHFSETIADDELIFDHTIKKGPLKTRNAIRILEINDYPPEIIKDANQTVDLLTSP
jgi:hypothetical protein